MKKFVALIQVMTVEQDRQLISFIESKSWGFWHWIDGGWLITPNDSDTKVATELRDKIKEIAPGKHCLVFEVGEVKSWAGFGPSAKDNDMFEWIKREWKA
jgi:succinate dehydrogenase flavin-adding protein (antitoxin of CptAB toxin-antitoxin module)